MKQRFVWFSFDPPFISVSGFSVPGSRMKEVVRYDFTINH
jgi:hypothetical protein